MSGLLEHLVWTVIRYLGICSVPQPQEIMGQSLPTVVESIGALVNLGFLLQYGNHAPVPVAGYRWKLEVVQVSETTKNVLEDVGEK